MLVRISATTYANAARQLRDGNPSANPLALALLESGQYALTGDVTDQVTLRDIQTGERCAGSVPAVLAEYLAGFRRGVRVFEDHEFALTLMSDDGDD